MFVSFAAGLLADFDRYLERDKVDLLRDGVSFGIEGLWLDDDEFREMMLGLYQVLQPLRANSPGQGRRRRLLASVLLPGDAEPPAGGAAVSAEPGNSAPGNSAEPGNSAPGNREAGA